MSDEQATLIMGSTKRIIELINKYVDHKMPLGAQADIQSECVRIRLAVARWMAENKKRLTTD
jgi:hypothetical protein